MRRPHFDASFFVCFRVAGVPTRTPQAHKPETALTAETAGNELQAMGRLWAGYGQAMGRLWADRQWAGNEQAMGWQTMGKTCKTR